MIELYAGKVKVNNQIIRFGGDTVGNLDTYTSSPLGIGISVLMPAGADTPVSQDNDDDDNDTIENNEDTPE